MSQFNINSGKSGVVALPAIPAKGIRVSVESIDTGVRIPRTEPPRKIHWSAEACISMFGKHEAVEMNFIPQMMTAVAIEQATEFGDYCARHGLTQYKRHVREIRICVKEFHRDLQYAYGPAYQSYLHYYRKLKAEIGGDLFKAWVTFSNEASKQYIGREHYEIPARVTFIRMILTFVEDFEKIQDRLILERTGCPSRRAKEPWSVFISALCIDIAEKYGEVLPLTDNMKLCVTILANKCKKVVQQIIREEDEEERN